MINITNLFHVYNKKTDIENTALKGVNITFNDHFFSALVGKTGSGKSTLAQHLNYLLKPSDGTINIDEFKISAVKKEMKKFKPKELRKNVGYLFQFSENQLFGDTVLKDVMFGPLNFGIKEETAKEYAIDSLKKVGICSDFYERSPLELSGGEKRRIAIAGVLACHPKYLILDEPTAGLDHNGKNILIELLKTLYQEGISILLITHDMDVVLACCENVIEMKDGTIKSIQDTFSFFEEKLNSKHYEVPEIYRFCRLFEKESIKKCRTFEDLERELN